jgi:DHA3 family macrolide efflux protein-like MFS transporter
MGMAGNLFEVPYFAYVQSTVPPEMLGRVISLLMSAMTAAIPLGLMVAGPSAEEVGIARWFFWSGIAIVVATMLGWWLVRATRRS